MNILDLSNEFNNDKVIQALLAANKKLTLRNRILIGALIVGGVLLVYLLKRNDNIHKAEMEELNLRFKEKGGASTNHE